MENNPLLSCLPVSLFSAFFDRSMDVPAWSEAAAQMGLDRIDVNIRCLLDRDVDAVAAISRQLALPVLMVTTYSDFTNPTEEGRMLAVEQAKLDIRKTAALGASYLRLTAGQSYPDQDETGTIEGVYRCFEACIPDAEAAGIRLLIENHSKPGAWQYPDFNFHFDRMAALWQKLQALPIGVNYDTANAFAVEKWRDLLDLFRGRIETVHVNDLVSVQPLQFCCIGDGIVPLQEQFAAIYATGFNGPICIEEAGMQGLEGIRRSIDFTKQLLK